MAPLLALGWIAALGTTPLYVPAADIKAIDSASQSELVALNKLLSTPINKDQASSLKNLINELISRSDSAAAAARLLHGQGEEPSLQMAAALKNRRGARSAELHYEEAAAAIAEQGERWRRVNELARSIERDIDLKKDRRGRQATLDGARDKLKRAEEALKEGESRRKTLDEARRSVKETAARGDLPRYELGQAVENLGKNAASIRDASLEAKARIDALGTEPQNETRGRAYQKLSPIFDGARAVLYFADAAKHRAETFWERYAVFLKAAARFEDSRKAVAEKALAAKEAIASAEEILNGLKE